MSKMMVLTMMSLKKKKRYKKNCAAAVSLMNFVLFFFLFLFDKHFTVCSEFREDFFVFVELLLFQLFFGLSLIVVVI